MTKRCLLPLLLLSCASLPAKPTSEVADGLAATVRIHVQVAGTVYLKGDMNRGVEVMDDWSGSGFMYGKVGGSRTPTHTRILSAHHVLDTPPVGMSTAIPEGILHIDAVLITATTASGRTCEVQVLVSGDMNTGDAAVGEMDCDGGPTLELAPAVPPLGAPILIVGYPLGWPVGIVTQGFYSGWGNDGFQTLSAPAAGGNSGGPVLYEGKVIGLLVRGLIDYEHVTMATPLQVLYDRVEAADKLQ